MRVLYDGDCPLCVREVDFLRRKDAGRGKLDLVDIASARYDPSANRGIEFATAMSTIHVIEPNGDVITGVEVFERAYAAVGLYGVYAFARVPALLAAANKAYDFWAERRMEVTGRGSLAEVLELRRRRLEAEEAPPRVPWTTGTRATRRSNELCPRLIRSGGSGVAIGE